MISLSRFLLPRPKHFLGFLDLKVGAELILLCSVFNKVSGIYGLLAILTGAEISGLQISMYVYSVLAVLFIAWVEPHLRKRTPFPVLSFGYFYLIDSIINLTYTTLFATSWFLAISEPRQAVSTPSVGDPSQAVADVSGGSFNAVGGPDGTEAPIPSYADAVSGGIRTAALSGLGQPESVTSLGIIAGLWIVRIYFCLVVLAYARQVVRDSATPTNPPFTGRNGEGIQGTIGRFLIKINRGYWEGPLGWSTRHTLPQIQPRKFRRSIEQQNRKKSDVVSIAV